MHVCVYVFLRAGEKASSLLLTRGGAGRSLIMFWEHSDGIRPLMAMKRGEQRRRAVKKMQGRLDTRDGGFLCSVWCV